MCLRGVLDWTGKGSAWKWEHQLLDIFYNNPIRNSLDSLEKNSLKQGLKFWYIIWEVPTQASKAKEKGKRGRIWSNAKWCLTELASALWWAMKRHSESLSRSDLWHMRPLEMGYKEKACLSCSLGRTKEREFTFPATSHCLVLLGQNLSHWELTLSTTRDARPHNVMYGVSS